MSPNAQLLFGFALIIACSLAYPLFPRFLSVLLIAGSLLSWWRLAQVIRQKDYPPFKQKAIQAALAAVAMAIATTPLPLPAKLKLILIWLAAVMGWFSLFFSRSK
ncbi:MAG: hypothetical protein RLZZ502_136 [Pseudomonadota bacterium]